MMFFDSFSISTFFFSVLGFEFRVSRLLGGVLPLEPLHQPFFVMGIFEIGSCELFAGLALNHNPLDLCLLSS
jgi:hypothetical protein